MHVKSPESTAAVGVAVNVGVTDPVVTVSIVVNVVVAVQVGVKVFVPPQLFDITTVETWFTPHPPVFNVALLLQPQLTGGEIICMFIGTSTHPVKPGAAKFIV
jgi:hypothetical protein